MGARRCVLPELVLGSGRCSARWIAGHGVRHFSRVRAQRSEAGASQEPVRALFARQGVCLLVPGLIARLGAFQAVGGGTVLTLICTVLLTRLFWGVSVEGFKGFSPCFCCSFPLAKHCFSRLGALRCV